MAFENAHWINQDDPMWFGAPDDPGRPPGDIDPKRSLLVGDLGIGYDQPIALDYRESLDEPRVLTLEWRVWSRSPRWVEVAPNVRKFSELIGL